MASSPSLPSHSRSSSQTDQTTEYSLNLDALALSKDDESSLMDSIRAIGPSLDVVRSEDIEGPSDFTQNMEFWMRGGKISDTKREAEESETLSSPEEHTNGEEMPAVNIAETNDEEQIPKLEQQLVDDESNVAAQESQLEEKHFPILPGQCSAKPPLNSSDLQFKIKELETQLATATSTITTLVNENNRLQLERDEANLRQAEAETLRDSFETRNEQSCERVKTLSLELKHLRNQVERTGVKPARLMIHIDGLKSANERSKAEVKRLEGKIEQLEDEAEQFKVAAKQAQNVAQRQKIINLRTQDEANKLVEKFEQLEAEREKALADFERFKSVVQDSRTRCEYYKGRFEDVSEKAEYFEKKKNEADPIISQWKEQSLLHHYKMALKHAKTEYDILEFEKDGIVGQRDWLSDKCDRYAESLRKQGWARRAARERGKKTRQELETLKRDFENVNAEMDKKIKELLVQRDYQWITRIKMVDKDRKIMSQILLQEWGKAELGKSEPQVYQYQCTDVVV